MPFVNEFVSEADIKKYHLDALWLRWHPFDKTVPSYYRHIWAVDRERDAYFIQLDSGGNEVHKKGCVLFWRGIEWQVGIAVAQGSSPSLKERPFRVVWDLLRIQHPNGHATPTAEIIPILKEALTAYGYCGALQQVPHTVVEFNF